MRKFCSITKRRLVKTPSIKKRAFVKLTIGDERRGGTELSGGCHAWVRSFVK